MDNPDRKADFKNYGLWRLKIRRTYRLRVTDHPGLGAGGYCPSFPLVVIKRWANCWIRGESDSGIGNRLN
ncbi:hypothetical protein RF55_11567 [Lasius niger]|uniref:Uncharacterized protein n=1 Tax=Lasius niger TaxID=67767 RepID=A0A0J7N8B5_LASNI|nr:hypothetical protein RF55_11567 [Lasius niger]